MNEKEFLDMRNAKMDKFIDNSVKSLIDAGICIQYTKKVSIYNRIINLILGN